MNAKKLNLLLSKRKFTIATAESCTGGMLASAIIGESGASEIIKASIVTYSNDAKVKYAGVKEESLKKHGAVSEKVAGEMAKGIAKECGSNVGVGISGIAGPTGAVPGKPVGTVCFGFSINGKVLTETMYFKGSRTTIRKKSVNHAIKKLENMLK